MFALVLKNSSIDFCKNYRFLFYLERDHKKIHEKEFHHENGFCGYLLIYYHLNLNQGKNFPKTHTSYLKKKYLVKFSVYLISLLIEKLQIILE